LSSPQPNAQAEPDIGNPRDIQGILALTVTGGFLAVAGVAVAKASSIQDVLNVLQVVAAPALLILGFYFGQKSAQQQ
jgi:sulfite exporter TauE/SafE